MLFSKLLMAGMFFLMQQSRVPPNNSPGYPGAPYICNYAKVKNIKPGHYLSVRSGPDGHYRQTDRLSDGTEVYICDEDGAWVQIFYGSGPCSQTLSNGIGSQKTAGCKSGWVNQKWIETISG